MSAGNQVKQAAREAGDNKWLESLARAGFAVDGVLHVLIGIIAVRLAMGPPGGGGGEASHSGALQQVASNPFGQVMLWIAVIALAGLGLWQAVNAVTGVGPGGYASDDDKSARLKAAAKAVLYFALAFSAFRFAQGGQSSQAGKSRDITASLIDTGFGRVLVGVAGLVVIGVGAYLIVKGARHKFLQDLERTSSQREVTKAVYWLGTVGYIAKGAAIVVVGGLFVYAAATQQAGEATGMDGALQTIGEQPYGPFLLLATGLGFAAFGVYLFARARYARM